MKLFIFNQGVKTEKSIEDNGWVFNSKFKGKLGWFSLRTPKLKEITYSKGPMVRYQKHMVYGIGFINRSGVFRGVAMFDPNIRILISITILIGVAYVSMKFYSGIIWAFLFYILISFVSSEDDDRLIRCCKLIYES